MKVTESERAFLHELNKIKKDSLGKRIVHFFVSQSPGGRPAPEKINKAIEFLRRNMERAGYLEIFTANNGDVFVCYSHITISQVMGVCSKIQGFFLGEDVPNTRNLYGEYAFFKIADATREIDAVFSAFRQIISENQPELKKTFKNPLQPEHVALLRDRLAKDNIRNCLFNQPCYNIANKVPCIEYLKFYLSLDQLESTYVPDVNLLGNPWNFLALAEELDRASLRVVAQEVGEFRHKAFCVNVALRTMMGKEFGDFINQIPAKIAGKVIVEVNKTDLLQHAAIAKDIELFRQEANIKLCVGGLDFNDFDMLNLQQIHPEFIKVDWRNNLLNTPVDGVERICRTIKMHTESSFVLARCDNPKAFPFAKALGISLVQGKLADKFFRTGMEM